MARRNQCSAPLAGASLPVARAARTHGRTLSLSGCSLFSGLTLEFFKTCNFSHRYLSLEYLLVALMLDLDLDVGGRSHCGGGFRSFFGNRYSRGYTLMNCLLAVAQSTVSRAGELCVRWTCSLSKPDNLESGCPTQPDQPCRDCIWVQRTCRHLTHVRDSAAQPAAKFFPVGPKTNAKPPVMYSHPCEFS